MASHGPNDLNDLDPAWFDYFLSATDWSAVDNEPHSPQDVTDGDERVSLVLPVWSFRLLMLCTS